MNRYLLVLCTFIMCFLSMSVTSVTYAGDNPKVDREQKKTFRTLLNAIENMPLEIQGEILESVFSPVKHQLEVWMRDKPYKSLQIFDGCYPEMCFGSNVCMIYSVAFSPSGKWLASAAEDGAVKVYDAQTGKDVKMLAKRGRGVYSLAFSPDESKLVTVSRAVTLWDVQTREKIWSLHDAPVSSIAFCPDGKHIISGSWDHRIRLWDVETGNQTSILTGHQEAVFALAVSPDGKRLASGSRDGVVKIWDMKTEKVVKTLSGHKGAVTSIAFHPNRNVLISGSSDGSVRQWDIDQGIQLKVLTEQVFPIHSVFYYPNGKEILVCGKSGQLFQMWDDKTGRGKMGRRVFLENFRTIALSQDGRQFAVGEDFGTVEIGELYTKEEHQALKLLEHSYYRLSPSQKFLLYLLNFDRGKKDLFDMERKLTRRYGSKVKLLKVGEIYEKLPPCLQSVVREYFHIVEPRKRKHSSWCNVS